MSRVSAGSGPAEIDGEVDVFAANAGEPDQGRHQHPRDPRPDAPARGLRIVHPVQREDEQGRCQDGGELGDGVGHCFLNIFSMRSVIRNPLTMFVMDANSATAPRTRMMAG